MRRHVKGVVGEDVEGERGGEKRERERFEGGREGERDEGE